MLRALVLVLLVANGGVWAWSQGGLRALGLGPEPQSEPGRLAQQLHAQALQLQPEAAEAPPLTDRHAARADAPVPADTPVAAASVALHPAVLTCLQAGPFDEAQAAALRTAAAGLPAGSWRLDSVLLPGRWMVYIGQLADADAVRVKRAELRELGVDTDRPGTALEPGLSLGRFSTEEAAGRALTDLGRKGVRSARVVPERRDTPAYQLRLPQADSALRRQVLALGGALAGRELHACD